MSPRRSNRSAILTLTLAAGVAACAAAGQNQPPQQRQLAQAVDAPPHLRPPEELSATARDILRARMTSHAHDMKDLMSAIMLLHYPQIREDATRIAGDASLSRPLSQDATELNAALPEKFFLFQDSVRLEARTLAEAAGRENPFDVADSYGRLSQDCVRCHATYRAGR
jgi:hypothetical protein